MALAASPVQRPRISFGRIRTWPLAVQMVIVSVGVAAALAVLLTAMGYYLAARGLRTEAAIALAADARVVTDAIEGLNRG